MSNEVFSIVFPIEIGAAIGFVIFIATFWFKQEMRSAVRDVLDERDRSATRTAEPKEKK